MPAHKLFENDLHKYFYNYMYFKVYEEENNLKEYRKDYFKKNKDSISLKRKKYSKENIHKERIWKKEWKKRNWKQYLESNAKIKKRGRDNLSNHYVKSNLLRRGLQKESIDLQIIELYRKTLQIKRRIKNKNKLT